LKKHFGQAGEILSSDFVIHPAALSAGWETPPRNLQRWTAVPALYLRSVRWITTVFHGLRCHPLTCMLLKIHLTADSIPSALTIFSITYT
jgi:hypothetical protein